jgi:Ser-tRNA(Ala) deacylase AlaX
MYTINNPLKVKQTLFITNFHIKDADSEIDFNGKEFVSKEIAVELLEALKLADDTLSHYVQELDKCEEGREIQEQIDNAITNAEK